MEDTTVYKIITIVVLLAFWWYVSERLIADPSLTIYIIPISYGMLTVITIVIQLVLRENIQAKMRQMLNSEIENRKEELVEELNELSIYLAETEFQPIRILELKGLKTISESLTQSNQSIRFSQKSYVQHYSLSSLHWFSSSSG